MAIVLVLVGILTGMASVAAALLADLGIVAALLAYPIGGAAGLLCTAALLMLCHATPARPSLLAQARD